MPTYSFSCIECDYEWDQYYSFQEFDEIIKPGKINCPKCLKKAQDKFHPPNINLGNTIGAQAERNNRALGSYGLEARAKADEDRRVKKKPKKPKKWYGELSKETKKSIDGLKGKEKQQRINKYIREGK